MGSRVIPERRDEVVALEDGLDDAALNASTTAVDEADLGQAPVACRPQILVDDRRDVPRGERVKIEFRVDGDDVGGRLQAFFSYSATTVVVMPPRAVKAPVTVMRLGAQTATRSSRMRLVAAS